MKSLKKFILALAVIPLILLAFPGAAGQGEKFMGNKNVLTPAGAGALNGEAVMARVASLAVSFVPNAGRFDKQVFFSADLFSGRFFLTGKELVYSLVQRSEKNNSLPAKGISFKEYFLNEKGGRIAFQPAGEEKAQAQISYFRGNDPVKWRSGLASYNSVSLGEVYPGILVKLRASGKNVEKMFYVSAGSDASRIRIGVAGVAGLRIADDGRLLFKNSLGELAMRAPVAWQEIDGRRQDVKVSYRLSGEKAYGFEIIGNYAKDSGIIIDPDLDTLMAATFFGGNTIDESCCLIQDKSGNVYVTGETHSNDFPTTDGVFDRSYNSSEYDCDVFISKFNGELTDLLASTFLGGNGYDYGVSLALDDSGNIYLTGGTNSTDFPITSSAYKQHHQNDNCFVSKMNGNLSRLLASTFLDAYTFNDSRILVLDNSGNVYLAARRNGRNVYGPKVCKLDGGLTTLLASYTFTLTYETQVSSLVLDSKGNVFLAGKTDSPDFPITTGAYDSVLNGSSDNFIAKLDGNLTKILAATFLGGDSIEGDAFLALDAADNVYLAGETYSQDFPTTLDAFDRTIGDWGDVFVSKMDNRLTTLLASTFLGGCHTEEARSLALDNESNVYLAGNTHSFDFPTTLGAYDRIHNPRIRNDVHNDAYISKLDSRLKSLMSSTFLGGSVVDRCMSLILDRAGSIYLTGVTQSGDFPTTPGAYDRTGNGWLGPWDVFIARLNGGMNSFKVTSPDGGQNWVAGTTHDIDWTHSGSAADVRIELSTDNGSSWSDITVSPARYRTYPWTVPNTPSSRCRVRISDVDHAATSDTSDAEFSILMDIDLQAERREARTYSIARQYGQLQFLIGNSSVPVEQYGIWRRKGNEGFVLLTTVTSQALQNGLFRMQDKYLDQGTVYTYRVEAYGHYGLIGISAEKTI